MKRMKLFFAAALICGAAFAGYTAYERATMTEQERALLANLEALTQREPGQYDYSDGYPYTSICNVKIGRWSRCKVEIITCQGGGKGCNEKKCPTHTS